jgi:hypothetical protein
VVELIMSDETRDVTRETIRMLLASPGSRSVLITDTGVRRMTPRPYPGGRLEYGYDDRAEEWERR